MPKPLLLIPPSEGKAAGGDGSPWAQSGHRFPSLDAARRDVIDALHVAMRSDPAAAAKLLGVGSAAAAEAVAHNLAIDEAPTLPAISRYQGVLYDALAYPTLTKGLRTRIDEQVVILSAVWGIVAPLDPVPDYKLKMGASLAPLGRLSTWWRPTLSPVIDELATDRVVWNLLPGEHAAAWRTTGTAKAIVRVRFLDDVVRKGQRSLVTVSHWNKLLKGALVRHVVEHQLNDPDALAQFTHPQGYVYRPELTTQQGNTIDISLVAAR